MLRTLRLVPVMVTQDLGFSDKAYRVQQQLSPPGSSPGHFRQTKEHVWSSSSTDSQFVSCRARVGRRFRGGRGGGRGNASGGTRALPPERGPAGALLESTSHIGSELRFLVSREIEREVPGRGWRPVRLPGAVSEN